MLSFREVRKRCKATGFHCHHIIPTSVVQKRSLARLFGKARSVGFEPDDFASNGIHLPTTEKLAVAFSLPLHTGPHRQYNEMVASQIADLERLKPHEVLMHLHALQLRLRHGLRRGAARITLATHIDTVLIEDFQRLDTALEKLYASSP
jgi:A nuclease family of the HNH/ENDO VII superfamily with conserved AHH